MLLLHSLNACGDTVANTCRGYYPRPVFRVVRSDTTTHVPRDTHNGCGASMGILVPYITSNYWVYWLLLYRALSYKQCLTLRLCTAQRVPIIYPFTTTVLHPAKHTLETCFANRESRSVFREYVLLFMYVATCTSNHGSTQHTKCYAQP
jgi:hypothetical protein